MSRPKGFWEGAETNQSPGNGPFAAAGQITRQRSRPPSGRRDEE